MEITSQKVKELREKTGAGMMDCKNALVEAAGEEEKAVEILRKKGLSRVAKRTGREAKEGLVEAYVSPDTRLGVLVEVNCETDFVAKTDEFRNLVSHLTRHLVETKTIPDSPEVLLDQSFSGQMGKTLRDAFSDIASKLGENLILRRFCRFDVPATAHGLVEPYIHTGAKLGVLVELEYEAQISSKVNEIRLLAKEIAIHTAAANPMGVHREEISAEFVAKEKEIYRAQIETEGKKKPPEVMEKIVTGKLEKFYAEVCLVEQPWVKLPEKTIKQLLSETAASVGGTIGLRRFCRFKIGE